MAHLSLNTGYFSTNRGVIKILQIIIGFIICSLMCATAWGGRSCFGETRIGFASGLNFVVLIINIVFFVLNFLSLSNWSLEKTYSAICTVLFLIAGALMIWFIIERNNASGFIISTVLVFVQFVLFIYDTKILNGESPN
uniref:MARVEL domain-containing protein n=1 Tax=Rhabditophanes sp. KR3021 TaxID=114890 RepID=A0AC35UIH0_9BILA